MSSTLGTPSLSQHSVIELESIDDSRITDVSVYSGRAEVTRLFCFKLEAGLSQVHINGLPDVMEQDSVR